MTTKIPNNVMKPPKGFEYVINKNPSQQTVSIVKENTQTQKRIDMLEGMIFKMSDELRKLKRHQVQQYNSSKQKPKRVWMQDILEAVAKHYKVNIDEILGPRRLAELVEIRSCYINLCHELTTASQPAIGRMCGNRDHTTVIHHIRLKRNKSNCWDIRTNKGLELWSDFTKLESKLKAEAEPDNE